MVKLSVAEYFRQPESMRPMELVYGMVREPPAPRYGHQSAVTHLGALLDAHVRRHALGQVCVSPVDVVLDEPRALVVQPDIIFIAAERLHVIKGRVWGPPDLVVEVLSPRTANRDRSTKLEWYRRYGVREAWLVDRKRRAIEVIELASKPERSTEFIGDTPMTSAVVAHWNASAEDVLS